MGLHQRKCWDCGNVAQHASRITPGVLCEECGSQDTRPVRGAVEVQSVAAEIAVAVAGKSPDDYYGTLEAIRVVLDRFGIEHMQRPRAEAHG